MVFLEKWSWSFLCCRKDSRLPDACGVQTEPCTGHWVPLPSLLGFLHGTPFSPHTSALEGLLILLRNNPPLSPPHAPPSPTSVLALVTLGHFPYKMGLLDRDPVSLMFEFHNNKHTAPGTCLEIHPVVYEQY